LIEETLSLSVLCGENLVQVLVYRRDAENAETNKPKNNINL